METQESVIGKTIRDFMELKEMSRVYAKKKKELQQEYNRLLTEHNGEAKNYSLQQADRIYQVYCDMSDFDEKARIASESFLQAEEKLREIGQVLYNGIVHAEITLPAMNGSAAETKSVVVSFQNGQVDIY